MTTIFCSNETVSLERNVEFNEDISNISEIWNETELKRCLDWITEHNFEKVCLQFPDNLISFSSEITTELSKITNINFFILGDTSYGSCCVDEIAAAHISANAIIHFGHACLSKVTRLPVLYIFPKFTINQNEFIKTFTESFKDSAEYIRIFYDVGYYHQIDIISKLKDTYINLEVGRLALNEESDVLCWSISDIDSTNKTLVYIGRDNQSFFNLTMSLKAKIFLLYDTVKNKLEEISPLKTNWMKKRYYYIEKVKDAQTIGIVVGTLSSEGYLNIVKHIQNLTKKHGIRSYIISVGKVNPAKLANFIDIDCFVLVGCPENTIYNSREFFKPLVSVFELEMALNPVWHLQLPESYCTDFKEILPKGKLYRDTNGVEIIENDVSLVSGKIRNKFNQKIVDCSDDNTNLNSMSLQEKGRNDVATISSSDKFGERSWQGLDPALGQNQPAVIEQGRSGIPLKYTENSMDVE